MDTSKSERLIIKRKGGEDGYKNFSIRVKSEIVDKLDDIAAKTNRSRNDLINLMLEYGILHCDIQ